jgi:hypothetical protein
LLRQRGGSQYCALFGVRHAHRVPDEYVAMLDACG